MSIRIHGRIPSLVFVVGLLHGVQDGGEILFASTRLGSPQADALDVAKTRGGLQQIDAVLTTGGRPTMLLPTPALDVAPSADGQRLLYTDRRSFENE